MGLIRPGLPKPLNHDRLSLAVLGGSGGSNSTSFEAFGRDWQGLAGLAGAQHPTAKPRRVSRLPHLQTSSMPACLTSCPLPALEHSHPRPRPCPLRITDDLCSASAVCHLCPLSGEVTVANGMFSSAEYHPIPWSWNGMMSLEPLESPSQLG